MKRILQNCCYFGCCITLVSLLSCKRDVVQNGIPSTAQCQIKKIIVKTAGITERSGTFSYNGYGDPIEYIPEKHTSNSLKYEFRYDNNKLLTDYIGYYPPTGAVTRFEFWTKYFYDDLNRVVRDSIYYYGNYGRWLTDHANYIGYTNYEYDKQGRISRTVYRQIQNGSNNGVVSDLKYTYNEQGNLVGPGTAYDDKISIYRTNRIWMFLNRNYSTNNLRTARAYSAKGLPLSFDDVPVQGPTLSLLNLLSVANSEIVYDCK
jgi:hypothetical protein